MGNHSLTDNFVERVTLDSLDEFFIGQTENREAMTGCTVIISPEGAVCGMEVRGGSPATRDTDSLNPLCNRSVVHAILLTGGSLFGLEAADGLVHFLEEKKIGRNVNVTVVPNVCAAALFDLKCGASNIRPDIEMGRKAAENAFLRLPFQSGNFGAGTGATVGKGNGLKNAMKGGIGAAVLRYGDLVAGAIFAVNGVGDVRENGKTIVGARMDNSIEFADGERMFLENYSTVRDPFRADVVDAEKTIDAAENTVIGCIITNAQLNKAQATRLAAQGQNAIARMIYPAHTVNDGDTVFALCSGKVFANPDAVSILSVHAAQEAILNAVKSAETYKTFLSWKDREKMKNS